MREIVDRVAGMIPVSAYQCLIGREVVGFLYHLVSNQEAPHVKHLYSYKTPKSFEEDLHYLKSSYNMVSYEQLLQRQLPPRSAFISFDDGFAECFSTVRPILLRHKVPCIFFVTTDFIDNKRLFYRNKVSLCIDMISSLDQGSLDAYIPRIRRLCRMAHGDRESVVRWMNTLGGRDEDVIDAICQVLEVDVEEFLKGHKPYMTGGEIKQLGEDGFTIGAHAKSHYEFQAMRADQIEEEMIDSCLTIMNITGQDRVPFSFPFNANGIDRRFLEHLLAKYRFIEMLFDCTGVKKDRDFIIDRIPADEPAWDGQQSNICTLVRSAYGKQILKNIRMICRLQWLSPNRVHARGVGRRRGVGEDS